MIRELFKYFYSKSTKEARTFGHLYESISLIEREKRCRAFWLSHRENCKLVIAEASARIENKSSVLILGSGPLHEIPIELLANTFNRVDLIDVVHLRETKNKFRHLKNVNFIEADVTELEKPLLQDKKPINKIPTLFLKDNYDLVISANLLSQLSYHLKNFLEKKAKPKLSESDLLNFAHQVTLDHYQYLQKFSSPVILITDVETILQDKNDRLIDKETPYINFSFPKPYREWLWNVAPIPEYHQDISLKMKVQAFILNLH